MIQHSGPENFSVQPDNFPLIGVVIPTDIVMFDRFIKSESAIPNSNGPDRGHVRFAGNGRPSEAYRTNHNSPNFHRRLTESLREDYPWPTRK